MKPVQRDKIGRLYSSALELEPGKREAFLKQSCGGDESLQEQILSLISCRSEAQALLKSSSTDEIGKALAEEQTKSTAANPDGHIPLEELPGGDNLIDGKYRVQCCLGQGGMGTVYRVRHENLSKDFALKLIHAPEAVKTSFVRRFQTEAKALGKLKHPNIVDVTDYGVDPRENGLPYLTMEYLQGGTLQDHIRTKGRLSPEEALPLLRQIARAVDYAHGQGVLHCDLKPGNVILAKGDGESLIAKILDFGLARLVETDLRQPQPAPADVDASGRVPPLQQAPRKSGKDGDAVNAGTLATSTSADRPGLTDRTMPAGTPAYMAPEVIRGGRPTVASDIYALGVVAYQALVGVLPFGGHYKDIIEGHLHSTPPAPTSRGIPLSESTEKALLAPLGKNPLLRPRSAVEMVRAIGSAFAADHRRKWLVREMPRRLSLSLVLALAPTLLSLPLLNSRRAQDLERQTVDPRFALRPLHAPDPRILVLTIDDASLDADQTLLSDRADEFGAQLERVFEAGADGIAIDFLLPSSWSRSEKFSRFVLRSQSVLTLAALSTPSGETIGTKCLAGLTASALGPDRFHSLFGFVNLDEDSDGIVRRSRLFYLDSNGGSWDAWAVRAARPATNGTRRVGASDAGRGFYWIDYSTDWQRMERISWKDLSRYLESDRSVFRHRLVLVGGDFVASGDDYHRIPSRSGSPRAASGIMLEALMLQTILANFPIREMGETVRLIFVLLICAAALAGGLCIPRVWLFAMSFIGINVLCILAAVFLFRWSNLILPMAGPVVMGLVASGISLTIRRMSPAFPPPDQEA